MRKLVYIIGGMCTGKSTLGKELEVRGARFIDLDFYGKKVVADLKMFASKQEIIGYISTSKENLANLNSIVHPRVFDLLMKDVLDNEIYVIEYSGYSGEFNRHDDMFLRDADLVIATNAPNSSRLMWLEKRRLQKEQFEGLIDLQPSQDVYESVADIIFYNDDESEEVRREQIDALWSACCK